MQLRNRRSREALGIDWRAARVVLLCPVCGRADDQQQIAAARVEWQPDDVIVARCGDCQSIVMSAVVPPGEGYLQENWDLYVEQSAGIEAIAETLALVSTGPGARMLDVGCGYGFGLDLGERLRGWNGTGLDPSPVAAAGRAALGIDIRTGLLDAEFAPRERFDVIFASELFEHLPDPRAFLEHVRNHLVDDGVLVLATPDAAIVDPSTPLTTLSPALSIGHHVFLATAAGLRQLLEEAGLVADIESDGTTLKVVAAPNAAGLRQAQGGHSPSLSELARYCADRAHDAPVGSALALGMVSRQVKFTAYDGDFAVAAATIPALRDALFARHNIDLDDPASITALPFVPAVVASAGYFAGVVAEYVDGDHDRALALFTASALAGRHHRETQRDSASPEVMVFETKSLGEQLLIFASHDPDSVRDGVRELKAAAAHGACDPEVVEAFKLRTELLMNERFAHARFTHRWFIRVKYAIGRRIRRRNLGRRLESTEHSGS